MTTATPTRPGRCSPWKWPQSSLSIDRERKGSLFARAGLPDYWVLNLIGCVLEVYREPAMDGEAPFGCRYARREVIGASGRIAPLALPGAMVAVVDLLP